MRTALGWEAFEDHVNTLLHLDKTVASGSQAHDPGDGTDRRHHFETDYALQVDAKYTVSASYSVNRKYMRQAWERAMAQGKQFALPIRFADERTGQVEDYVVVPLGDFAALVDEHRSNE